MSVSLCLGAFVVNPFLSPGIRFGLATLGATLVAATVSVETRADETQAYERAVASLTAGRSDATVMAGYETLEAAGSQAFPVLIVHVNDTTKAPPGHFEEECSIGSETSNGRRWATSVSASCDMKSKETGRKGFATIKF